MGFPDGSVGKESAYNAGDTGDVGSVPVSGRSPEGGHGNPMDRGTWQATVQRVEKSRTRLSTSTHM